MVELTRTVRFCLNADDGIAGAERSNTFAAWPAMRGLGRYYELQVRCRGEVDPVTGYFINIKAIDSAVRGQVLTDLERIAREQHTTSAPLGHVMRTIMRGLQPALDHTVIEARLQLTPMLSFSIGSTDMDHVLIRQQYEFSAAHRLHVPSLSDQENREIFGKCNNPSGHGHNYRIEVCVRAPIDPAGGTCDVALLDSVVNATAVMKLDHKHLNIDVPEFAAMNPSVEHIAKVIHGWLAPALKDIDVELDEISVWETGKTVCTYRG
ncbi:MAG: 6-carboxytetrahydropterin synthase [Phycisphaeraceae bacterium]